MKRQDLKLLWKTKREVRKRKRTAKRKNLIGKIGTITDELGEKRKNGGYEYKINSLVLTNIYSSSPTSGVSSSYSQAIVDDTCVFKGRRYDGGIVPSSPSTEIMTYITRDWEQEVEGLYEKARTTRRERERRERAGRVKRRILELRENFGLKPN